MVVFGGSPSCAAAPCAGLRSDVMLLSANVATQAFAWKVPAGQAANAPAPRGGATLTAADPKRLIMYGGRDQTGTVLGDVRVLLLNGEGGAGAITGAAWKTVADTVVGGAAPAARERHSVTALPSSNPAVTGATLVLFGGAANGVSLGDTWVLTTGTVAGTAADGTLQWTRPTLLDDGAAPGPREGHAAAAPTDDTVVIFGGCDGATGQCYNDVFVLRLINASAAVWHRLPLSDNGYRMRPLGRAGASFAVIRSAAGGAGAPGTRLAAWGGCERATNATKGLCQGARSMEDLVASRACPAECLNGAAFVDGDCKCADGFTGRTCASGIVMKCPSDCNGHGDCKRVSGKPRCMCFNGYNGTACQQEVVTVDKNDTHLLAQLLKPCPKNCAGHGRCNSGNCTCQRGFSGEACDKKKCPADCSGHGNCDDVTGTCECNVGYAEASCWRVTPLNCPLNCSTTGIPSQGACKDVDGKNLPTSFKCVCTRGFEGADCNTDRRCPYDLAEVDACNGHGKCKKQGCACNDGFAGKRCDKLTCPGSCSGHGICNGTSGDCKCSKGYARDDCSLKLTCPADCSKRGNCIEDRLGAATPPYDGLCVCETPFTGPGCGEMPCPNATSSGNDTDAEGGGMCGGHGACVASKGMCDCDLGFAGPACTLKCDNNCTNHGVCFSNINGRAVCACEEGWRGTNCQHLISCPYNCSGTNGVCHRAACVCHPGFSGEGCQDKAACPGDGTCSSHGTCRRGVCFCNPGYGGDDCGTSTRCPSDCNGNGKCTFGKCFCDADFVGVSCEEKAKCPMSCSSRGLCVHGKCMCQLGFMGDACQTPSPGVEGNEKSSGAVMRFAKVEAEVAQTSGAVLSVGYTGEAGCPSHIPLHLMQNGTNACSNHGQCILGKCWCDPGFEGRDCSLVLKPSCPKSAVFPFKECNGRGFCKYDKCHCEPGYFGKDCTETRPCHNDCHGNGICHLALCYCAPGFQGVHCESKVMCANNCTDRGICVRGKCLCEPGYGGVDCSQITLGTEICPADCSGRGKCQVGKCFCNPGYSGPGCEEVAAKPCPNNCNKQGRCAFGHCFCDPGFTGQDCSGIDPCPKGCREHGLCAHGMCFCQPGWKGENCSTLTHTEEIPLNLLLFPCPNGCSMHGICFKGKCLCEAGYTGQACDRKDKSYSISDRCPNDCRGVNAARGSGEFGLCILDKCFCYPGFGGAGCDQLLPVPCPADCNARGICSYGKCFCDIGWTGEGCEKIVECPLGCTGNGVCHLGHCDCNPGWEGDACERSDGLECKNGCNGRGLCFLGECFCKPGYDGDDCGALQALPEPPPAPAPKEKVELFGTAEEDPAKFDNTTTPPEVFVGGPHAHARRSRRESLGPIITGSPYGNGADAGEQHRLKDRIAIGPVITGSKYETAEAAKKSIASLPAGPPVLVEAKSNRTKRRNATARVGAEARFMEEAGRMRFEAPDVELVSVTHNLTDTTTAPPSEVMELDAQSAHVAVAPHAAAGAMAHHHLKPCPNHCSGHGTCVASRAVDGMPREVCLCDPGFTSKSDCSVQLTCGTKGCSGHGVCKHNRCYCHPGFEGVDCAKNAGCSGKHLNNCNGHGTCANGRCYCALGFMGADCGTTQHCGLAAGAHGHHVSDLSVKTNGDGAGSGGIGGHDGHHVSEKHAIAVSVSGSRNRHTGKQHARGSIIAECSGHGVCQFGQCYCDTGHTGSDCAKQRPGVAACARDCSGHGLCQSHNNTATCFCEAGWMGASCSTDELTMRAQHMAAAGSARSKHAGGATEHYYSGLPDVSVLNVIVIGIGTFVGGLLLSLIVRRYQRRRRARSGVQLDNTALTSYSMQQHAAAQHQSAHPPQLQQLLQQPLQRQSPHGMRIAYGGRPGGYAAPSHQQVGHNHAMMHGHSMAGT